MVTYFKGSDMIHPILAYDKRLFHLQAARSTPYHVVLLADTVERLVRGVTTLRIPFQAYPQGLQPGCAVRIAEPYKVFTALMVLPKAFNQTLNFKWNHARTMPVGYVLHYLTLVKAVRVRLEDMTLQEASGLGFKGLEDARVHYELEARYGSYIGYNDQMLLTIVLHERCPRYVRNRNNTLFLAIDHASRFKIEPKKERKK